MASPFNTSSIPHHTPLKNKGLQPPHSTASSAKVHDTRQPHEPQSSPHTQTGSYNPLFAVVPQRHSFNPRSRVGSDCTALYTNLNNTTFQSTLPRGERQKNLVGAELLKRVSIHAPAWGATSPPYSDVSMYLFQSTLPRGERHCNHAVFISRPCFNPRSRVGSDIAHHLHTALFCVFQSTLPRGERP